MSKTQAQVIIIKKGKAGHDAAHGGAWKVAYADFVTAMMAFFLLMWLIAALKPQQKAQLSVMFQDKAANTGQLEMGKSTKIPKYLESEFKLTEQQKDIREVVLLIKDILSKDPKVLNNSGISSESSGVLMHVNSAVMFEPSSAVLTPQAGKVIDGVVRILQTHNIDLVVRGHADEGEIVSNQYPTKWELSAARAASVVNYIVEKGKIPTSRIRAVGYADSRPLVPALTSEDRAKNRRVEFFYHSPDTQAW